MLQLVVGFLASHKAWQAEFKQFFLKHEDAHPGTRWVPNYSKWFWPRLWLPCDSSVWMQKGSDEMHPIRSARCLITALLFHSVVYLWRLIDRRWMYRWVYEELYQRILSWPTAATVAEFRNLRFQMTPGWECVAVSTGPFGRQGLPERMLQWLFKHWC